MLLDNSLDTLARWSRKRCCRRSPGKSGDIGPRDVWGSRMSSRKAGYWSAFGEKRSPYVADLSGCEVLHPSIGGKFRELAELIEQLEARARIPQIEVAVTGTTTALVFRHLDPLRRDRYRETETVCRWTSSVGCTCNPADRTACSHSGRNNTACLTGCLRRISRYCFRPTDFTQINAGINEQMIARVLEMLALDRSDRVLDPVLRAG